VRLRSASELGIYAADTRSIISGHFGLEVEERELALGLECQVVRLIFDE
jgi:hypothetical protein